MFRFRISVLSSVNMDVQIAHYRTAMAGVPGTASTIFGAVKDVGANVIMISQASTLASTLHLKAWCRA